MVNNYVFEDDDTLSWQGQRFPNIRLQYLWTSDGLSPELMPAFVIGDGQPCPYYLAVGQQLVEDAAAGTALIGSMVALDKTSPLYQLRQSQDEVFGIK